MRICNSRAYSHSISARLSVCLSVTRYYYAETAEYVIKLVSPSCINISFWFTESRNFAWGI